MTTQHSSNVSNDPHGVPLSRVSATPSAGTGMRWYGPTVLLLVAMLGVMLAGPGMIRSVAHARTGAELVAVRTELDNDASLSALSNAFKQVARAVEPSVVHIEIQSRSASGARGLPPGASLEGLPDALIPPGLRDRFSGPRTSPNEPNRFSEFNDFRPVGNGSGWVYRFPGSEGSNPKPAANYVITNAHVVRDVGSTERIQVTLYDRTEAIAEIVGQPDDATDVAVLRIVEGGGELLHAARTGVEDVEQGEIVFAFGSPFGAQFSFSMSQGIVSAVGRQVGIISGDSYENFIQTDAAINPGNSGGPLVNVRGEIIGMNTAIATNNRGIGGGAASSGVGFAIPVKMATRVADRIIVDGVVRRGFLGVRISDLDEDMASTFGYEGSGVLVESAIEGGAALAAGIENGDIITAVDGEAVGNTSALRLAIANRKPGNDVTIEVFRGGETRNFDVQLGSRDGEPVVVAPTSTGPDPVGRDGLTDLAQRWGITGLQTLDDRMRRPLALPETPGVLVTSVRPGSIAAGTGGGLRPNDTVIVAVMNRSVASVEEFNEAIASFDPNRPIRLTVLRRDPSNPRDFVQSFVLMKLP